MQQGTCATQSTVVLLVNTAQAAADISATALPPAAASSRRDVGSDNDGRLPAADRALADDRRKLRRSAAPLPVLCVAVAAARAVSMFGGLLTAACGSSLAPTPSAICMLNHSTETVFDHGLCHPESIASPS